MYKYILKRILLIIPVLLGVILVVFFIMDLSPVNPAQLILGDGATEESIHQLEEELGLDDPFFVRYGNYVLGLLKGDMGLSYKDRLPVFDKILERLPNTVILAVGSILIALLLGIPLGILCAKHQNKLLDNVTMVTALVGISMPLFWLALLLVLIFSVHLHWLPSSGFSTASFGEMVKSVILPTLTLATLPTAMITRMTRSSILEVIRADYIDTARSKGLKESIITRRHMERGGCSDSAYPVQLGIPTVCSLGPIGRYEHTLQEQADIGTLGTRAKLLTAVILHLAAANETEDPK